MTSRKEQIKEIALRLLNDRGIDGVSTRDIAGKLGISVGNLTYHYPTKNDIILALCRDLIARVDAALDQLNEKPPSQNTMVFFFEQCKTVGIIQQQYRFIFERRYAEIVTSSRELLDYYQETLERRFAFYLQLHTTLVKEQLAIPALVKETNALSYMINILGLFWHQESAIYFPEQEDNQKLQHALAVFFQLYKPYLTRRGMAALRPRLIKLGAYEAKKRW